MGLCRMLSGKQRVISKLSHLIEVIDCYTDISPFNRDTWQIALQNIKDDIKQNLRTIPFAQRKKNNRENLAILCGEIRYINVHPHENDSKRFMIQSAIYPFNKTTGKPSNLNILINAYDDNAEELRILHERLQAFHQPTFVRITGYLKPKTYVDKSKGRMYLTYLIVKEVEAVDGYSRA